VESLARERTFKTGKAVLELSLRERITVEVRMLLSTVAYPRATVFLLDTKLIPMERGFA
jgi:hypothetical protein